MQLFAGNDADEFSTVLKRESTPKILITTCRFNSTVCAYAFTCYHFQNSCPSILPCQLIYYLFYGNCFWIEVTDSFWLMLVLLHYLQRGPAFIEELLSVIPNAHYYKRGTYELKKVPLFKI